ncbi:carboxypeptidase regulatory-like domain-containing protein [Bacillus megaterium]|nr:carboxypeptidase regulatory-like domain-containing protein [Priestia megaterium]
MNGYGTELCSQYSGCICYSKRSNLAYCSLTPNPGNVNGQVVNRTTGDAILSAIVSVTDLNGLPIGSTVTDQNGNFSIPNLPATTIIVSAVATNFGSDSRSVILTAGSTGTALLTLTPNPGSVSGTVINQQTDAPLLEPLSKSLTLQEHLLQLSCQIVTDFIKFRT